MANGPARINSLGALLTYLRADAAAFGDRSRLSLAGIPTLRFQVVLRLAEYATNCLPRPFGVVAKRVAMHSGRRLGFTLEPNVAGPGLCLAHWGTVTINPAARLGANCRISVDVVVGISYGKVPTIGNDVYIGPGAKIYGDTRIGDGSVIGANAVVSGEFPPRSLIVGSPARRVGEATRWP